jgi:muconolactone delta-isomerase
MSWAVMVTMTFDPSPRAEIVAHVPAEQARIRYLRAQGAVDALSIAEAQDRVWLVVRGHTLDAVRDIAASLPLHAYATVELAPLAGPSTNAAAVRT